MNVWECFSKRMSGEDACLNEKCTSIAHCAAGGARNDMMMWWWHDALMESATTNETNAVSSHSRTSCDNKKGLHLEACGDDQTKNYLCFIIRLGICDSRFAWIREQMCVFQPTVGGESASLHPDSRKPRGTSLIMTDVACCMQSSRNE